MKVKRANRLMSIIDEIWEIHLQKVDTLLMIGNYPLLLKMMGICIFPLHCCTLYFRKDCLHVHF
jgi:hypothetical protein